MAENTAIEWADHTFNPWEGCQKVGPGCEHCYAEVRNARFGGGTAPNWGPHAPRRRTSAGNWRKPRQWQAGAPQFFAEHGRRQRVFCASLADVFDSAVDPQWRCDLAGLIEATPDLDWLLLTKRIGNAAHMLNLMFGRPTPPENVWIGATIVNQAEADRDIPKLLVTPAAVRFLSMEPLLGSINLEAWLAPDRFCQGCDDGEGYGNRCASDRIARDEQCPWRRAVQIVTEHGPFSDDGEPAAITCEVRTLDWVIVGGENGPRPVHPDWIRSPRDQCATAGVPFLFKQWGWHSLEYDRDRDDPDWRRCAEQERGPGQWLNLAGGIGFHGDRVHYAARVGKKAAGRLLDGVEHNGFPGAI